MKTKSECFASGLGATIIAGMLLLAANTYAQPDACAAINCDCASLVAAADKSSCEKQQADLASSCKAAGNHTGYCRVAGLQAYPLPFSIDRPGALLDRYDDIESSLGQLETLYWTTNEDLATAIRYQERSAYGNALTAYKTLNGTLDKIYGLQRTAIDSYRALDKAGEGEDIAEDGWEPMAEWAQKLYVQSRELWGARPESDAKLQQKRQVLAMNVLRYAASASQQAAELAALADEPADAASLWRQSGEMAELMVGWRTQTRSKAQYINYFQQQGVAAWHRAALYYDLLEEPELAVEARAKADDLAKINVAAL